MLAVSCSIVALVLSFLALGCALLDWVEHRGQIAALTRELATAKDAERKRAILAQEVAHEIKNPLTAILCSAETLELLIGDQLESIHRRSLTYIREYGDQLLRLLSDFLDVSCLQTEKMQARPESVPIDSTLESVVGLLQSKAQTKAIDLHYQVEGHALRAMVDPRHLKQIIFNLVHNALKFTPEEGEVRVTVRDDFPHHRIRIAVTDNGPGISPSVRDRLFDPYVRSGHPVDGHDIGTGLGLTLCQALVELGNGSIEVESAVGIGTTFEVFLPSADPQPEDFLDQSGDRAVNKDRELATERPLAGRRLLLLDKHHGSSEAISRLLEAWGGMVSNVSATEEAIAALASQKFDTLIVDEDTTANIESLSSYLNNNNSRTTLLLTSEKGSTSESGGMNGTLSVEKPLNGARLLRHLLLGLDPANQDELLQ